MCAFKLLFILSAFRTNSLLYLRNNNWYADIHSKHTNTYTFFGYYFVCQLFIHSVIVCICTTFLAFVINLNLFSFITVDCGHIELKMKFLEKKNEKRSKKQQHSRFSSFFILFYFFTCSFDHVVMSFYFHSFSLFHFWIVVWLVIQF